MVSKVLRGPNNVGDDDLIPLVSETVSVISSAAVNLVNENAGKTEAKQVAKKLVGLSALAAAGEMRAAIVLCSTGLTINCRIHVRSIDDALRRITVYTLDNDFAKQSEETLDRFKAEGLSKMTVADRDRILARADETSARFEELTADKAKPLVKITQHSKYGKQATGLDAFQRWAYSQPAHVTMVALVEIYNRLSLKSDAIYTTEEAEGLLISAIGMGLAICGFLKWWGVEIGDELTLLMSRLEGMLRRRGLLGDESGGAPAGFETP